MVNNKQKDEQTTGLTGEETSMQGVDKAPGEETNSAPDQFLRETQKGKKVDADPSEESNQPVDQP